MPPVETVDAVSTIRLLESIEAFYPMLALIHVFLDNARYHHAKLVQDWFSRPDCRIRLHFIPAYCPHLNPIERLWGVMHKHVTHNKCYATCTQFADATLGARSRRQAPRLQRAAARPWGLTARATEQIRQPCRKSHPNNAPQRDAILLRPADVILLRRYPSP
jgi:transposase